MKYIVIFFNKLLLDKFYYEITIPFSTVLAIRFYFQDKIETSNFILLITFGALLWYSFETRELKGATKRSNELSQEPILIIRHDSGTEKFTVENVGKGPAFNIEIQPMKIEDGEFSFYFKESILKAGESMKLKIKFDDAQGSFYPDYSSYDFTHRMTAECIKNKENFLGMRFILKYHSRMNNKTHQMKFDFRHESHEKNPDFDRIYFIEGK